MESRSKDYKYPIKELRESTPTCNLRWSKLGILEQQWIEHWATWENEFETKWFHEHLYVWKSVPTE